MILLCLFPLKEQEVWLTSSPPKEKRDGKKTAKLPERPKTAEETWQQSVIGDYVAKYRVSGGVTGGGSLQHSGTVTYTAPAGHMFV